ncbi:DgyrCDS9152 [Dimorphilus gyrociliatus]|uniref:Transmembrane protein 242 n=1 Tax=Dimorphilus gyrociliatus TaxID=2664684 RepID=A0A7I8VXP6_9ANNE|nr:DgyrCDS9152 [Dimorphilus gyrociliatus]
MWFSGRTLTAQAAFVLGVGGASLLAGFGAALTSSKRKDSEMFAKGLENGTTLAFRALGRATLYSVGGFTLFCLGVCGMLGVRNVKDFGKKMQELMPPVPRKENPGKSDFKNAEELIDYIIKDGKKR